MKIKTLSYIHNLLKEEAEKRKEEYLIAATAKKNATDEELENDPSIEAAYKVARNKWNEADNALSDFEDQEW